MHQHTACSIYKNPTFVFPVNPDEERDKDKDTRFRRAGSKTVVTALREVTSTYLNVLNHIGIRNYGSLLCPVRRERLDHR